MTFIAGPYQGTYKGLALGQFDDGFELEYGAKVEDIISDIFPSREDGVYRGISVMVRAILNEPNAAGVQSLTWPWSNTYGASGSTGRLLTSMAGPLVLTKCSGTTAIPTSLTIIRAVIWSDMITSRYNSNQRKIPVVIAGLPVPADNASQPMGCSGGTFFTAI